MIQLLHSSPAIAEAWCFGAFSQHIKPQSRVAVVALSFRDAQVANSGQWADVYGRDHGKYYRVIVDSLAAYGINEADTEWINYFHETVQTAKQKIRSADIIYLPGGLPDRLYARIVEMKLLEDIRAHTGIVMGFSAGAMAQLSEYHITPDTDYQLFSYGKGCGLIDAFGIEVHYDANDAVQRQSIERFVREKRKPLYAIADDGALMVDNGSVSIVGNVVFFGAETTPGEKVGATP